MKRKEHGEYDLEDLIKFKQSVGDYNELMKQGCKKCLPINRFAEKAIKGDGRIDGHLPTKSDMDDLLGGIRMIPPAAELLWDYFYDETGQRLVEVTDCKGFVALMSEELFNRLGLNEKAKMTG